MTKNIYNAIFLLAYVVTSLVVLGISLWIQPFEGDLTRIGGVEENNYGWHKPLKIFLEDHTVYHEKTGLQYTGKEDILVFGDSFSHMSMIGSARKYGWESFLYEEYGLTSFVYHVLYTSIEQWLSKTAPEELPDYVIYQQVERGLKDKLKDLPTQNCFIDMAQPTQRMPPLISLPAAMQEYNRDLGDFLEINTAIHWLRAQVNRVDKSVHLPLIRDNLFSHHRNDQILILARSLKVNRNFTEERVKNMACYFWSLKQKIESNGRTKFIVAIVPDKFTVYAPYIRTDRASINLFDTLEAEGLYIYRFDSLFQEFLEKGVVDLYLPNDTHWGTEGSRIFASAIYDLMKY